MLACERVGEAFWLAADLQEPCVRGRHLILLFLLGIPQILVYVLGLPVGAFLLLRRQRNSLRDPRVQYRWGLLYAGYRPGVYWWEITIVIRKVALVVVGGVFGSRLGPDMQVYMALALVVIFIILHLAVMPYEEITRSHEFLHWLELGSLLMCWFTLYCGSELRLTRERPEIIMSIDEHAFLLLLPRW